MPKIAIAAELLEMPIQGRHLNGATLREQLQGGRCLLVFLRHFG